MTEQSLSQNPQYDKLVAFLLQPLLDEPEELRINCEYLPAHARVWVRIAFQPADREKLLNGSSRHLYAIKTVVSAAARIAGQSVYLDIYGSESRARATGERSDRQSRSDDRSSRPARSNTSPPRRVDRPIPATDK
jgi:predicted RNA-binding protein YlqC (UPF0109 family)